MFSKQHCWNAVLPTLTPSSALWSAAACVTNRGSRAWKFPSQTHLQPTQRFRHPPPCFLRIFLLSYLASCRQQAPGSGTAALITRCANLVPRHVNCLVLPALARPGGDSVHQAVTFRTTNAWPGTPLIFSCTSTTPELGWMCPIPSSVCLPATNRPRACARLFAFGSGHKGGLVMIRKIYRQRGLLACEVPAWDRSASLR